MNLAHKHDSPQGEVIQFPKQERQDMSKKEEGYTRLPNSLIDEQIMAQLSDKAFKCLMLIIRQTSGFNRSSDKIATTQFQEACGIKKTDKVYASIKELEQKSLIKVERKTGGLNTYYLLENQSQNKVLPENGTTPKNGEGTTPKNGEGTTPENGDTTKENIKENFKENTCSENPVDTVLKLWTPDLDSLNAWLQRSGIAKMTQAEVDGWLLEINGYYSTKLEAGLLTDTQMYTNFVKWIKRNFSSRKPAQPQTSRNVNDAWSNQPTHYDPVEPVELEDWML
ncbi:replication protein [Acinetobacter baumannii]|uniref:replication protein n=1 Tax=Acinetobacter baumannii TaxID=470 RepID=UPI000450C533|nr:replication protein [Acinetobacter baumannii]EHU1965803.1 replication protein [Acinetobacter baumannii]EKU3890622.1 replication protein [Acinetobacter baumannii]EXH42717.1 phage replication protein O domain protein [Acinetobacter baumannii 1293320]KQD95664.1 replication protein [Acinetobacter baumannii]KQD98875.1 replication protein [Acinetobacter baumannii]